jgi:uncharacterized membrane protein YoaT (DUF817 family)
MAPRSVTTNRVLLKVARLSGWVLLVLVSLFVATGYALSGQHGFDRWIGPQLALAIHRVFDVPLLVFFGAHAATVTYFALRRWRVIGNEKKARRAVHAARGAAE